MTRRAPVFRWTAGPDGNRSPVRVGELTQEQARWEFQYDRTYLAEGQSAWELDPQGIRLKQGAPFTQVGVKPFPVFCDVALAGWSLDILQKRRQQFLGSQASPEPWGWWERLLYAPADGFGSLFVGELGVKPAVEDILAVEVTSAASQAFASMVLETSEGAMAGERPKVLGLFRATPESQPVPTLFKFALPSERSDTVVAEATALTLAKELGMKVPDHHIAELNGTPALCISRFDRGPGATGPVFHCVSAATALGLHPGTDIDDPKRSYVSLRSKLREPGDALELFRRIVLNAAVGNTDDHPWNTSLRQMGLARWELAPLYDVLPFFHRSGVPVFRMAILKQGARTGSMKNLVAAGRQIGGLKSDAEARDVISKILAYVHREWRPVFDVHARLISGSRADCWQPVFEFPWQDCL